eukprot:SAG11_NODE_1486_length_4819_cov_1.894280_2_plen_60_part_00
MDLVQESLVSVAIYCDGRQWLEGGGDGDEWPSVDVVLRQGIYVDVEEELAGLQRWEDRG